MLPYADGNVRNDGTEPSRKLKSRERTVRLAAVTVQSRLSKLSIDCPAKGRWAYFGASGVVTGGVVVSEGVVPVVDGGAGVVTGFFVSPQPVTAMAVTSSTIANRFFIALVS
jgi:hypothetical protein